MDILDRGAAAALERILKLGAAGQINATPQPEQMTPPPRQLPQVLMANIPQGVRLPWQVQAVGAMPVGTPVGTKATTPVPVKKLNIPQVAGTENVSLIPEPPEEPRPGTLLESYVQGRLPPERNPNAVADLSFIVKPIAGAMLRAKAEGKSPIDIAGEPMREFITGDFPMRPPTREEMARGIYMYQPTWADVKAYQDWKAPGVKLPGSSNPVLGALAGMLMAHEDEGGGYTLDIKSGLELAPWLVLPAGVRGGSVSQLTKLGNAARKLEQKAFKLSKAGIIDEAILSLKPAERNLLALSQGVEDILSESIMRRGRVTTQALQTAEKSARQVMSQRGMKGIVQAAIAGEEGMVSPERRIPSQQWKEMLVTDRAALAKKAGLEGKVGSKGWAALSAKERRALGRAMLAEAKVVEITEAKLPAELSRSKPRYGFRGRNFGVEFESDVDRALYIIAAPTRSKRHGEFVKYLQEMVPDATEAELKQLGAAVRTKIKASVAKVAPDEDTLRLSRTGLLDKSVQKVEPVVPKKGTIVPKEGTVKEPWQMTREEFVGNKPSTSEEEAAQFTEVLFNDVGKGGKGTTVQSFGKFKTITYRDSNGNPVVVMALDESNKVVDLAIDKSQGLLSAKALLGIEREAKKLGVTGASSMANTSKEATELMHKYIVREAVLNGKPVPLEVLKDYPDLISTIAQKGITPAQSAKAPRKKRIQPPAQPEPPKERKPIWAGKTDVAGEGGKPPAEPPPVEMPAPELPSGRKPGGIQNQKPYTPQDEYQKVVDAVTQKPDPFNKQMNDRLGKFMREWYDRNYPLAKLEAKTGIPAHTLAQLVPGSVAAGQEVLRKWVRPVLKPVGKDLDFLEQYMVLMRNSDIMARNPAAKLPGGVSGWKGTYEALDSLKSKVGDVRYAQIEKTARQLWKLNDDYVLKPLLDNGIIDSRAYTAIKADNPHYIPWKRQDFVSDLEQVFSRPEANLPSSTLKNLTIEGSERALAAPLVEFESQFIRAQTLIARNKAAKAIAQALEQIDPALAKKVTAEAAEHSNIWETVTHLEGGQKVITQVPEIYARIAKGMEWEANNSFINILAKLSAPLRYGAVTYNPAFLPVNLIRDALTAFYRERLIPLSPDWWRGWTGVITKGDVYHEAAMSGTFMSGIVDTMRSTNALRRVAMTGAITVNSPKDALLILPRLVEKANLAGEQATRLATFRKLRAEGIDAVEAALRSRDVTVDFSKAGTSMKILNQIIPFANAGVQGSANVLRTMRDNPKWAVAAAAPFGFVSLMARVNNMRYETSELIPDYEYTNNWVFQIGEIEKKDGTRAPLYIKFPKGQIGSMLSFPVEALASYARETNDKTIAENLLAAGVEAGRSALPFAPDVSSFLPPVVSTGASLQSGVDLYTRRPIVPRREENLLPEQQFGAETSKVAVALGQQTKVSPRLIDFAIKDYTAGTGQLAMWLLDAGLGALGYGPQPFGSEAEPGEGSMPNPVAGRFVGSKDTRLESMGWDNFSEMVDGTNRIFNDLPRVNELGLRLGEVGNSIEHIELTPNERAEYQLIMAEYLIPEMDWVLQIKDPAEAKQAFTELKRNVMDYAREQMMETTLANRQPVAP